MNEEKKTSSSDSGLDPKVASLLAYLFGIVGGIVFYVISKDPYVKFHSMQSILLWVTIAILWIVLMILNVVIPFFIFFDGIVGLAVLALSVIMMVKAYNGERYKLPIVGDMAEKYAK